MKPRSQYLPKLSHSRVNRAKSLPKLRAPSRVPYCVILRQDRRSRALNSQLTPATIAAITKQLKLPSRLVRKPPVNLKASQSVQSLVPSVSQSSVLGQLPLASTSFDPSSFLAIASAQSLDEVLDANQHFVLRYKQGRLLETPDLMKLFRTYASCLPEVTNILTAVGKLLYHQGVQFAQFDGKRLIDSRLHELQPLRLADLADCALTSKNSTLPWRQYRVIRNPHVAASKIQACWKGFKQLRTFQTLTNDNVSWVA